MARAPDLWAGIHRMTQGLKWAAALAAAAVALSVNAAQIDIPGPEGSAGFGSTVTVLPNGNIVVTDPGWFGGRGAVHLYSPAGVLISSVTGILGNDRVGGGGVNVLSNGNYVVASPDWDNGFVTDVGAVTWGNADVGVSGAVSSANSLIGTTTGDSVGSSTGFRQVIALSNGNYVVVSPFWNSGSTADVGAVTWANGSTGLSGVVSTANSLTGSTLDDRVGESGVTALSNGNYVVSSRPWNNGPTADVGAVTWGDGSTGRSGVVSQANSLIGTTSGDAVGSGRVTALSNGNYVVASPGWNSPTAIDVGAVTWANGSTGLSGAVSPANSLVGTTTGDSVGAQNLFERGVTALSNGNYVVTSHLWNSGATADVGAVTWADGTTGRSGLVSSANSLIGTSSGDRVGSIDVTALRNGNYVVSSHLWNNGAMADVGAVTWANGSTGLSGPVSPANSLIGTATGDRIGYSGVTALGNGNYVVASPWWDNGATPDAGAATWANGGTGRAGTVSSENSLVGTTANDQVGGIFFGVTALGNGHYVVASPQWNNGPAADAGAVTWVNGGTGFVSAVSTVNSMFGTTAGDQVGVGGVSALSNGNYVVASPNWDDGFEIDVGAVTWANGSSRRVGMVSPANSLIGTRGGIPFPNFPTEEGDQVGVGGVGALRDGNYVVSSPIWNGSSQNVGAVTLARGVSGLTGTILPANSVQGTVPNGGAIMSSDYDVARQQLVVGRPASNIVSLFTLPPDLLFANGFE